MIIQKSYRAMVIAFIVCLAILFICIRSISPIYHAQATIVVTTSMLADAVRNIVGNQVAVHTLMGPGVDPHLYRARESDVHKLAAADLVVFNGLHLEGKMGQVLEGMHRFTQVVNASDGIEKPDLRAADFDNIYDPHIWFDVRLWICVVQYIQDAVMLLDPEHATLYKENGDSYIAQLTQLDSYIKQRVNEIDPSKRILVTAHDAFGYFGCAYGFAVIGLQGLSTDADISTKDIQDLADYIVSKKIRTIFIETSIASRSMQALQEAVQAQGWQVAIGNELYSDALADPGADAGTYIGMIKYNIDTIVDALKK